LFCRGSYRVRKEKAGASRTEYRAYNISSRDGSIVITIVVIGNIIIIIIISSSSIRINSVRED